MLLKGQNGNELELSFTRDVLPEVQDGFGDGGWATVIYRAANADESWEESAPCMNMYEFVNLAEWLEALGDASGQTPDISEIDLLEPDLRFTVSQQTNTGVTIRVWFSVPDRPEEFNVDGPTDEAEYMDLHLSRASVRAAASALRTSMAQLGLGANKDDLLGDDAPGILGGADDDLNLVDSVRPEPPGAGHGEDNAGNT